MTMCSHRHHYLSENFLSTSNSCIATCAIFSRFVTLRYFLIPMTERTLKGHHYNDERSFRRPCQNRSAAFQQVLRRSASKTSRNAGSSVLMQEEAISKNTLSTRVQVHCIRSYTVSLGTLRTYVSYKYCIINRH